MGGLYPLSELEEKELDIPAPGSDKVSRLTDKRSNLHRYVHLCFRNTHPMEHIARQEARIGDTIFLQVHASVLQWEGCSSARVWRAQLASASTQWNTRLRAEGKV